MGFQIPVWPLWDVLGELNKWLPLTPWDSGKSPLRTDNGFAIVPVLLRSDEDYRLSTPFVNS